MSRIGGSFMGLFASLWAGALWAAALNLPDGISMQVSEVVAGQKLDLLGTGVRSRPGGRVDYVLGLYLLDGCQSAAKVFTSQEPKSARVIFVDGMSFERGRKVMVEDIIVNVEPEMFERVSQALAQLIKAGPVESGFPAGSWIAFNYLPGRGTVFVYNGQESQPIPGDEFYQALLMQWLGARPISRKFKQSILGSCTVG
ncbi:hypothetical protein IPC1232_02125 [Pseudomonas aeruginosa]|uniref:chalcone isomerase family protein n=1 Tax=Pseudomonas aeruginosa TaxID=287 RepID=UPI000FC43623|nr:chalcone isomerase family protein [Pseudomonas aeruginosa]RUE31489.1 hypothetical protein IPC1232_02125 [Pseudomonas aeruginosa]